MARGMTSIRQEAHGIAKTAIMAVLVVAAGWSVAFAQDAPSAADDAEASAMRRVAPAVSQDAADTSTVQAAPASAVEPVRLAPGETTETLAVKSTADLLRKLNLVAPADVKPAEMKESMETTPTQLLDAKKFYELIGAQPTVLYQVIYRGTPIPDPMVIPWIKNKLVLQERFDDAVQLLAEQKIPQAKEALLAIESEFPNSEQAVKAREIIAQLEILTQKQPDVEIQTVRATPTPAGPVISMNPDLKVSSVIIDPSDESESRVMINQRSYRIGDTVQGMENHKVMGINDRNVIIEVEEKGQTRQFEVAVRQSK